jgi:hypothetical protein
MPLTKVDSADVAEILRQSFDRCSEAQMAGGIREIDVVNGKSLPAGYWLDPVSQWYVPINFQFSVRTEAPS